MEFRVLGPFEVRTAGGAAIALTGPKRRALLGLFVLNAGEVMPASRLADELWHGEPPKSVATTLQTFIYQLRRRYGIEELVTTASGYVLDVATVERSRRGRRLLLIDLAVPRDLDPAIHELEGCYLYDIDDLEAIVSETLAGRRGEAVRAEALVAAEAEKFHEWQASLDVVPAIASLRARAEEIREAELRKAEGLLGRLDDGERRAVESITAQIVNKLLHLPTVRMKQAAVSADGVIYADAVRHLFGLGEEDRR